MGEIYLNGKFFFLMFLCECNIYKFLNKFGVDYVDVFF